MEQALNRPRVTGSLRQAQSLALFPWGTGPSCKGEAGHTGRASGEADSTCPEYSLSRPEWLMVINETDFVSGEAMAVVQ